MAKPLFTSSPVHLTSHRHPSETAVEAEAVAAPVDDALADPTLIEWMLDRSPEQRLEALQGFVDSVWELRGGCSRSRR